MSGVKSILVHVDASVSSQHRLQVAADLGLRHGADVTAVYAVASLGAVYPYIYVVGNPESIALVAEMEEKNVATAKAMFDAAALAYDRLHWVQATTEPLRAVIERGRYADLLILGQRDPADPPEACLPAGFVASVLVDSGRPALVVPYVGAPEPIGKVALVAWKNTRESARALSATLPFLSRCELVHVVIYDEGNGGGPDAASDVKRYLSLHGIGIRLHRREVAPGDIGDALLSLVADISADMLVMGCYGHSRAREWVLGGASRVILESMTVPVLMAH